MSESNKSEKTTKEASEEAREEAREKRERHDDNKTTVSFFSAILGYVVVFFVLVYILRVNSGKTTVPTFSSLLNLLSNLDTLNVSLVFGSLEITDEWLILDGLRVFINYAFVKPLEFIGFIVGNLYNLAVYIVSILKWIFVV